MVTKEAKTLGAVINAAKESKKSVLDYVKSLETKSYDETMSTRNIVRFSEDVEAQVKAKQRAIEDAEDSRIKAVRDANIDDNEGRMNLMVKIAGIDVEIQKMEAQVKSMESFKADFLTVKQ